MVFIDVPDLNDSIGRIELAGRSYNIRFTYNATGDYWSFGLYDIDKNPLLAMTKIVPHSTITRYYTYTDFPDGMFGSIGMREVPGRNDFRDGKAQFVFVSRAEIVEEFGEDWYAELEKEV